MSNLVPLNKLRSKYISLSIAALLACFAVALAVLPKSVCRSPAEV